MPEDDFCSVKDLLSSFCFEFAEKIFYLNSSSGFSAVSLIRTGLNEELLFVFLVGQVLKILVVEIEVAFWQDLEEGLSVEVDLVELVICLIVDVAVCKTEFRGKNTLWQ
jgi:hypothetical protein